MLGVGLGLVVLDELRQGGAAGEAHPKQPGPDLNILCHNAKRPDSRKAFQQRLCTCCGGGPCCPWGGAKYALLATSQLPSFLDL